MEYALFFLIMIPPLVLAVYLGRKNLGGGHVDLGLMFTGIVFVYAWVPYLGLVLVQHGYGVLQDQRVIDDIPDSIEIIEVGLCYLAFIVGFTLFYGWKRKFTSVLKAPSISNRLQVLTILAIAGLLISLNFLGDSLLSVRVGESYIDSYLRFNHLPLVARQIMNVSSQSVFAASLAAMVFLIAWKPRLHRYLALAIFILLLNAMFSGGSRTFGFLLAFSYVVCFSIYLKKFKIYHILLLALIGCLFFIFAGIFRADSGFDAVFLAPFQGGEFFSVFINSVDLSRRTADSGNSDILWQFYWGDLLRLIPQQILGFEKFDPALWYVKTNYPEFHESGGGLAFGAIAESVMGFGYIEAFIRGSLLGLLYAFVANSCTNGQMSPIKVFIYVWFVVMSYQAIRYTTFSVFPMFFFQVLPVIVLWAVAYRILREVSRKDAGELQVEAKNRV